MITTTTAATTLAPACGLATGIDVAENASPAAAGPPAPYATHPNTTKKETPMNDQPAHEVTDEDRRLARDWAANIIRTPRTSLPMEAAAAKAILHAVPAAPRPTLADMTPEERAECAGMQADLAQGDRVVILDGTPDSDDSVQVLEMSLGVFRPWSADVIPRPDLPRLEWPGTEKPAPALPGGWRLADHQKYGRVIVTNPTPDADGHVYFVAPATGPIGNDWHPCDPGELAYIDTPDAAPPNTLTVGSEWDDADVLARACEESGLDQIVVSDQDGYVFVWDNDAEWWEGSAPPRAAPFTVIHTGKGADQ